MTPIKLSSDLQRQEVVKHLLSLDREDLRLRFGYTPTDSIIEQYVSESWSRVGDRWFGIYDSDHEGLVATLHIAKIDNESAEFGFTVSKDMRNQGVGNALFKRGAVWAKAQSVKKLFMHCLSENKAVQSIAKKNEMHVVTILGGEAEADLALPYDPSAIISDVLLDRVSVYDMLLVNQQKLMSTFFRKR